MNADEITDALSDAIAELVAGAEADLERDLTPAERDSLIDEFLAGLDEGEEETPP
jgi:F0F1-type ATP synthase membrane subunit b/b'